MKWYLNIEGEAIIGAYAEKLLDNLIEYEADKNFEKTDYKYVNGQVVVASEDDKIRLYSYLTQKKPTEQDVINATLMKEIALLKVGALNE